MLQKVPLFSDLERRELQAIAESFKERAFSAGDRIASEGKGAAGFFVIESGAATVSVHGNEVGRLGAGDYFGEIALLRDVPRTATVTAAEEVGLLALDRDDFIAVVTGHPQSAEAADAVIATRLDVVRADLASA